MRKRKQRLKSATSTIVDFATGGLLVSLCILLRCVRTMRVQAFVASEGARRGISIAASMSTLSWGVLEENFSHRNKPKVPNQLESETEISEVDLVDTSQEHSKTRRLGVGKFGWVARKGDSAVSVKAPDDQQLLSEKLKGAHLLLNKENVLEEEKKENRNDDDKVEQEKDVYDKLLEAMENGNEELKEEMMDQMLEEFDRLEKSKTDKKCLEKKKVEPKKLRKKKGLGTKVKGRGR